MATIRRPAHRTSPFSICEVDEHEGALAAIGHPPLTDFQSLRSPRMVAEVTSLLPSADRSGSMALVAGEVSASAGPAMAVPDEVKPNDQMRVSDSERPNAMTFPSREVSAQTSNPRSQ